MRASTGGGFGTQEQQQVISTSHYAWYAYKQQTILAILHAITIPKTITQVLESANYAVNIQRTRSNFSHP